MKKNILLVSAAMVMAFAMPSHAQKPVKLAPRSKIAAVKQIPADSLVSAYLTFEEGKTDWDALKTLGIKTALKLNGIATVRIPLSKLTQVAEVKGVKYVQTSAPVKQMLDVARPEAGVNKVHAGTGLDKSYSGNGIVVGIVDAGFDYSHKAFYDKDNNLRIKRVWEQSSDPANGNYQERGLQSPEKFGYGVELSKQEDLEWAKGDITNNSHGTHVANIAAGSDEYMEGAFKGNAPEADIVLVSMGETSRDNVNLTNALAYIFDYADEVGKPCVINLSLGYHAGPHDGTSTFDVMADQLQGKGKLIVGSSGNHRTDKFHVARNFTGAEDSPLKTFLNFKITPSPHKTGGDIEIWGDNGCDFEVAISAYSLTNNKATETVTIYPNAEGSQEVELSRYASGKLNVASEISPLNNKQHVVISSALTNIRSKYAIALTVTPKSSGKVDIWADNIHLGLTSNGIEGFTEPDASSSTIAEIGGTAKRILTVGAYTTRNEFTLYGETSPRTLEETVGDISSFSSYGPTADGRIKPEVTAPGCFIISAVSSNDNSGTQYVAQYYTDATRNYRYGYMQGTSMAAPFVTGVVATWLEAYPDMTPEELLDVIKKTSRKDSFTGDNLANGNNDWGYGKIDAFAGIVECIDKNLKSCIDTTSPFEGTITKDGDNIRITFASTTDHADVNIYSANGSLAASHKLTGISLGNERTINLGGLQSGIYLLQIKTDKEIKTVKFIR